MSVCLPICLCIYVSVCPSVSQSVCQCVCLSVCLPVSLSACQSLSLSASQPASQSIFTRNASYAQTSSEVSAKRQRPSLACKHKFRTKFHKNDGKHQGLNGKCGSPCGVHKGPLFRGWGGGTDDSFSVSGCGVTRPPRFPLTPEPPRETLPGSSRRVLRVSPTPTDHQSLCSPCNDHLNPSHLPTTSLALRYSVVQR